MRTDHSFKYRGFDCEIKDNPAFVNGYMVRVFKDGKYQMGIKGAVNGLQHARQTAMDYVDRVLAKQGQPKPKEPMKFSADAGVDASVSGHMAKITNNFVIGVAIGFVGGMMIANALGRKHHKIA